MLFVWFFFFNDTATTEIYTLSLHDALPIWFAITATATQACAAAPCSRTSSSVSRFSSRACGRWVRRSEEHTSELQSRQYLVCRLLLEKKKNQIIVSSILESQCQTLTYSHCH